MKTIGILLSFAITLTMTVVYVNYMHVYENYMHAAEVDHLRMQLQIERAIVQAILD